MLLRLELSSTHRCSVTRDEFHQRTSCKWRQKTKAAPWMPDESYQEAIHIESQRQACGCAATRMFSFFLCARVVSIVPVLPGTVPVLPAAMLRWSSGVLSRLLDHSAVSIALCLRFSSEREQKMLITFGVTRCFWHSNCDGFSWILFLTPRPPWIHHGRSAPPSWRV